MIVVDASILVAIFAQESGYEKCQLSLIEDDSSLLPVSAYLEFLLISKLRHSRRAWIDDLVASQVVALTAIEPEHGPLAADAARRFGKGSGHPAQLNFGDCLVYPVTMHRNLPLLFVGNDFGHTDVKRAID